MANCWVCETKMPQGSAESCKGACSACHGRLRKKFGSKQWEEVAREAIKMGKRETLLAYVPCRGCAKKQVRQNSSKSMLCRSCNDKARMAAMTEEERQARNKELYRKQLEYRRRKLHELEARVTRMARPSMAASATNDSLWQTALREARKNPGRIVAVPVGNPILGKCLYFVPYLDGKGVLRVRQLDQNAKGG